MRKRSLLTDLWSDDPGGRPISKEDSAEATKSGRGKTPGGDQITKAGLSYAQIVIRLLRRNAPRLRREGPCRTWTGT